MKVKSFILCLLAVSCYNPDLPSGHFVCDNNEDCPTNLVCTRRLCVTPPGADLEARPTDMAGPQADMAADPCKDGWVLLAVDIYACRRSFTGNGNWTGLCRSGYHACDGRDNARLSSSTAAIAATCRAAGGFFSARLDVGLSNTSSGPRQADGNCSSGSEHGLLGCGSDSGLYTLRNTTCSGLNQAMSCNNEISNWSCSNSNGIDNTVTYSGSQGGVLCCKD